MDANLIQTLINLGMFVIGAIGAIYTVRSGLRNENLEGRKQTRNELESDYARVKKERDELLKQRDELFQQNRPSIELTKCIAEQEMLIESLRKDLLEVQTDRDFWIEFANKHWSQKVVRDYTEGRTY